MGHKSETARRCLYRTASGSAAGAVGTGNNSGAGIIGPPKKKYSLSTFIIFVIVCAIAVNLYKKPVTQPIIISQRTLNIDRGNHGVEWTP